MAEILNPRSYHVLLRTLEDTSTLHILIEANALFIHTSVPNDILLPLELFIVGSIGTVIIYSFLDLYLILICQSLSSARATYTSGIRYYILV